MRCARTPRAVHYFVYDTSERMLFIEPTADEGGQRRSARSHGRRVDVHIERVLEEAVQDRDELVPQNQTMLGVAAQLESEATHRDPRREAQSRPHLYLQGGAGLQSQDGITAALGFPCVDGVVARGLDNDASACVHFGGADLVAHIHAPPLERQGWKTRGGRTNCGALGARRCLHRVAAVPSQIHSCRPYRRVADEVARVIRIESDSVPTGDKSHGPARLMEA